MSLFEDYFITGRIVVPGGAFFSTAGMPTEAFLIAVMQGTNSDGINNDGDAFTDEADEADPNFRTVGDGDRYDAGATVENIKGIFEKAVLTGGDHNNTLVVNDSDNAVVINGQPLTVTPFDGSALLDNRGNEFDTNAENYVVSILPGNSTRVDIVDSGGASGVDRIVIFGTSQADSLTLDGAGAGSFRMGIVRATGTSSTFVTFRGVERAEVYTLGGGDRVLSNDTGAVTVVDLGGSDDEMVIGTVPLVPDTGNRTLEFPDGVPVADTQNMTNGNSHPLFVLGDGQNDRMEVNHNRAKLYLHGGDGNDRFLLKTFLVLKENPDSPDEITNLSNLFGGSGANRYDYLENGPVFINGGSGTDTIVVVGTPIGDTFVVTDTYVAGAGRIVSFTAVEVVEVDGAGGADTIYVLATGNQFETVITGGSGDDTIHVGGDPPTLVFDPPAFTYTPPAFTVALPPELVFTDHSFNLNNFTMTVSLFDWIGAGGPLIPTSQASIQTAGAAMLARFVDHLKAILSQTYQYLQVDALDVGTFSARLRFDSFFSFLFDPRVYVSVDTLTLRYRIGSLEPRTKQVQPAPVTVDPLPFGFDAGRSLDVSRILNRLTIRGGDQFETAGDKVVIHNEEGTSADGRLLVRTVPRMVQAGEIPGPNGTRIPVFKQDVDPTTKAPIFDTFLSVEGMGIGIDSVNGRVSADGQRFFGIELAGIEHLDIRLSDGASTAHPTEDGNDNFTIVGTPLTTKLTLWGGGGNDTFTVNGIGGDATIAGGLGNDTVNVKTIVDGINNDGDAFTDEFDELDALSGVLGRLTVDGKNHIVEQVDPVLAGSFPAIFLTQPLVVIADPAFEARTFNNQTYYVPKFVPILDNTGAQLRVYTVVITAAGTVAQQLVQERGVQQFGIQKRNASNQLLYFDVDGSETTDATKTGLPVITYVAAGTAGAQTIYIDETFNEVFGQFGANLATNGTFGAPVPNGAFGGGWTTANVDAGGGWRGSGGNPGARFILNSNGAAGSDPTISQIVGGLSPGVTYRISVNVRATGAEGDNTANTFGILLDGVFKTGTSRTAASGWITLTFDFLASAGSHTVAFAGERAGVDAAYEIDNVSVVAMRVPKYVTDWANGNALLYIDTAGRRVTTNTGKPSLLPINQVALGNFTRVYDKIVAGGGTDVLNIHSSGSGVGDLAVLMDTYRVPVDQLAGGVPVLQATGAALPGYHLNPFRKTYFGGEPVLDPFTGQQLFYAGGEPVLDLFTGEPVLDPFDNPVLHQANDPMLHIAGEPVYHLRGEQQRWLGGEAVVDELGNPVYNNATTPFLHASGQAIVENRRQVVYDLVDRNGDKKPADSALYEPRTLTASTGHAGRARLQPGRRRQGLRHRLPGHADREPALPTEFTFTTGLTNDTLTITKSFTGAVTIKVVIAVPAVHAAGDPKYYFGDDLVAERRPDHRLPGQPDVRQRGQRPGLRHRRSHGAAPRAPELRHRHHQAADDAALGPEGLLGRHAAQLGLLLHRQHADDHPQRDAGGRHTRDRRVQRRPPAPPRRARLQAGRHRLLDRRHLCSERSEADARQRGRALLRRRALRLLRGRPQARLPG